MKTILQIAEEEGATINEMSSDGDMNLCFTESTLERFAARIRAQQRGLLLWTLYHHQGGSSTIGQPIRRLLGIGQYERMTAEQIKEGQIAAGVWCASPESDIYQATRTT